MACKRELTSNARYSDHRWFLTVPTVIDSTFGGDVVVSANIGKDRRFGRDPPYYGTPPGHPTVTSYLGVPVTTHDGQVIAALFFGHGKANRFGIVKQKHALLLAAVAADALAAPSRRSK